MEKGRKITVIDEERVKRGRGHQVEEKGLSCKSAKRRHCEGGASVTVFMWPPW